MTEYLGTATYSPEDNKLRFYADARLSKEDYETANGLGFKWAPKQELFVAPMWTPGREDLIQLLVLAERASDHRRRPDFASSPG